MWALSVVLRIARGPANASWPADSRRTGSAGRFASRCGAGSASHRSFRGPVLVNEPGLSYLKLAIFADLSAGGAAVLTPSHEAAVPR
jgi:hypothetical protein